MTSRLHKLPLALCVGSLLATGFHSVSCGAIENSTFVSASTSAITLGRSPQPTVPRTAGSARRPTATLPVTSCEDEGSPGTLRTVVAGAGEGDTVDLSQLTCSTITLLSGQIEIPVDNLTINGPGSEALTIDANYGSSDVVTSTGRVFLHNGAGTLEVDNLTIANGLVNDPNLLAAPSGGCIDSAGTVVLDHSTVSGCRLISGHLAWGGGVAAATVTIDHGTISNNSTLVSGYNSYLTSGGGVHAWSVLNISDSIIESNSARTAYDQGNHKGVTQGAGGGVSSYGNATISETTIIGNFAGCDTSATNCLQAFGGGIRANNSLNLSSSIVSSNTVSGQVRATGGGVFGAVVSLVIADTTINSNHATNGGGVAISSNTGVPKITGSTIYANAAYVGGGIWIAGGDFMLSNATISGNQAGSLSGGEGGGLDMAAGGGALSIQNSTVAANTCRGHTGGGGVVSGGNLNDFESSIVAGNTNAGDPTIYDADLGAATGSISGANNLIVAANGVTLPPDTINADPMLGPLQDNGGLTWTHALLSGSPAIDTGSNTANLAWDQRGDGYRRVVGVSADIGAFEYSTGLDQAPVADNDSYTTAENATLKVSAPGVLGNDSDPDGDPLTAILIDSPSNGTLTLNADGSFVYVPVAGFSGTDSFAYEANDGQLNSNVATVTIKVSQVDQPPVAANDSYTTAENTTLKVSAPGVLGNDSDPDGDTLTAVLVSNPSNGTLTLNTDGSFVYVPAEDFSGTDTFTYEANDGQLNSNVSTVTISVTQGSADTIFADGFDGASP
jgi:hypothetical protein